MDFPQYRKRFDNKSYYKIINERNFEEVQLIGNKVFIHTIKAEKYFEILRIQEMIECDGEMYVISTEAEFQKVKRS
tara:strand:- start:8777 stop:9004 length:228 start_codon:yes stop_codon:yes gene_type:complete